VLQEEKERGNELSHALKERGGKKEGERREKKVLFYKAANSDLFHKGRGGESEEFGLTTTRGKKKEVPPNTAIVGYSIAKGGGKGGGR